MGKRFYWFKMKNGFFEDKRIKKLRKIAGGDTYTIIYLKMMLKSLSNNGVLIYEGVEDSFSAELALDLDEDEDNVDITVNFLLQTGLLVDSKNDEFVLPEVVENIGSETDVAQRVRKYREKQKALPSNEKALPSNVTVTKCNTENRDREKRKEKEIELELEKRGKRKNINYQEIIDIYNDTCVSLPRVLKLSEDRKKMIKERLNTYTLEDIKTVFEKAEKSDWLKGNNDRNWKADFDWILSAKKMPRILEGFYDNRETSNTSKTSEQKQHDRFQGIIDFVAESGS